MTDLETATSVAADLCRRFEGFRAKPYLCPAGVPTIGYGSTSYLDGRKVALTDPPVTEKAARAMLEASLVRDYLRPLTALSPVLARLPQALGALGSFAYNLGVPAYQRSTLRARVDAQDWIGAQTEIKKWTRAGGKVLPGLVKRRAAEAALLNKEG
ncbi:lysozyme [Pseudomonas sp.]|uniref:lysozyme n=1 Tax=Pseudomonas sp. TaxID=306 RepID=UPI002588A8B0|nr:lysozyme [Pseudomonas sp.]